MDLRSRTAVLLVALVALLAGATGASLVTLGPVAAAEVGKHHAKGKKANPVKRMVKKQLKKQLPKATAGNATALGGQPPTAYQSTAYTVTLAPLTTAAASKTWTLPAVPAGTYQATLTMTAAVSGSSVNLYCALYQADSDPDLLTAYGVPYNQTSPAGYWRTVDASRVIAVTGALHLQCQALPASSSNKINTVPASPSYAAPQLSFVKLDTATALGTAN